LGRPRVPHFFSSGDFILCVQTKGQNVFFLPPSYAGPGQPVTADFNHDGKPDLISADGTVLLGKGDGTFITGTPLSVTGQNKNLISTADFNGDGKPDLVLASQASNIFYVFLGNGDGTFKAPIMTTVASPLIALIVGDVNGDGKPDVLGAPSVSGNLFTYLGKGDGTFSAGMMSGAASSGTLADFNGDGKLDLAVAGGIQLGNGNGTFQALIPFPAGSLGTTVIGDFDGDGKLDFAGGITGTGSSPDQLQILFGNGDGTFRLGLVQSLPSSGTLVGSLVAAANLNNGGKADLIGETFPYVQIFKNNGDGTFTPGLIYNLYLAPAVPYLIVGDFNGDGNLDLATANTMLLGNGDGTLRGNQAIPNVGGTFVTGDFNNDGHPDIAESPPIFSHVVNIFLNDGTANLSLAHTYTFPALSNFDTTRVAAAVDVNGDGNVDLILVDSDRGFWEMIVMLGNGDGSFQSPTTFLGSGGGFVTGFAVADLNGDHKPDLLVVAGTYNGTQGFLWIMLNNGDGTFASPVQYYVGSGNGTVVVGDFNNDGKIDAAVGSGPILDPTATTGIAILLGNGDGTLQPATFDTPPQYTFAGPIFAADVNGDGNVDLLATINPMQQTQVLLGKGDGTFTTTSSPISHTLGVLQAADFNLDGKIDLLAQDVSGLLSLILGNGDGTFGNPILLIAASDTPVVADFNGDNHPDIAVPIQGATVAFQGAGLVWLFNTSVPPAPDFQIAASVLAPSSIAPGGSTTSTVTLTSVGGFNGDVALSCRGAPALSTCTVSPNSISLTGSARVTATVTVTTTAPSKGLLPPTGPGTFRKIDYWPMAFVLGFLGTMMVLALNVLRQT
jgi:hypothetical protein